MENPFKKIKILEEENKRLKARELDPIEYIRERKKTLEWYDYKGLDRQQWLDYWSEAQKIVGSNVFNNELQHLMKDIITDIAWNSQSQNETEAKRQCLVALESFKKRLESIEDPRKVETKDDIYEAI